MLTFSRLGGYGRLGNQMFQIASLIGLSKKYDHDIALPVWSYEKYFTGPFPFGKAGGGKQVNEPAFHYTDWPQLKENGLLDIKGYMQSEKYFQDIEGAIRVLFTFQPSFITACRKKMEKAFDKPVIAIQIRRGDYVGNPNYAQLPITYFILALFRDFPDWRDYNLLFVSDDIPYCKIHFECLENAFFVDGLTDIEQVCLMSECNHHIISNSSFGWWGAWLAERKNGGKVIRPAVMFNGKLLQQNDAKDYYPERWSTFDHAGKKLDLQDVTFTVPVFFDHADRKQNLDLSICVLQQFLQTNIIVSEQGAEAFKYMEQWCKYMSFADMKEFHRTKMLNDMAVQSETPFVVNWDCDVFIPPMQLFMAVEMLRAGDDMVFPYDGRFARVPRTWFKQLEKSLDVGIFGDTQFKGKHDKPMPVTSVGGAIMFNKDSFIDGGMENEHMISYGPEDCERNDRFKALGYKVTRTGGTLYHMDHWIGPNSCKRNPFFSANNQILETIRSMDAGQLREHVSTWPWVHKYTSSYYASFCESAVRSSREVYKVLAEQGIIPKTVIDIGCGLGEWGVEAPGEYTGVDYRVPKKKLLIPESQYIDFDLRSDEELPVAGGYDLVLCLEVAEHLPEEYADSLISRLCKLGDTILFSAAIPNQGGRDHVNEQWQTYWEQKFKKNSFSVGTFCLNQCLFNNEDVDLWYRQNIVLYKKGGSGNVQRFVHPDYYIQITEHIKSQSKK